MKFPFNKDVVGKKKVDNFQEVTDIRDIDPYIKHLPLFERDLLKSKLSYGIFQIPVLNQSNQCDVDFYNIRILSLNHSSKKTKTNIKAVVVGGSKALSTPETLVEYGWRLFRRGIDIIIPEFSIYYGIHEELTCDNSVLIGSNFENKKIPLLGVKSDQFTYRFPIPDPRELIALEKKLSGDILFIGFLEGCSTIASLLSYRPMTIRTNHIFHNPILVSKFSLLTKRILSATIMLTILQTEPSFRLKHQSVEIVPLYHIGNWLPPLLYNEIDIKPCDFGDWWKREDSDDLNIKRLSNIENKSTEIDYNSDSIDNDLLKKNGDSYIYTDNDMFYNINEFDTSRIFFSIGVSKEDLVEKYDELGSKRVLSNASWEIFRILKYSNNIIKYWKSISKNKNGSGETWELYWKKRIELENIWITEQIELNSRNNDLFSDGSYEYKNSLDAFMRRNREEYAKLSDLDSRRFFISCIEEVIPVSSIYLMRCSNGIFSLRISRILAAHIKAILCASNELIPFSETQKVADFSNMIVESWGDVLPTGFQSQVKWIG